MFSKLYLFFFDLGRVLCAPLLLFFRVKKCGTNGARVKTADLPRGAVYVCNHVGFSDPMVLGCAFAPRRLFFLVTTQATNTPVRGFLLRHCGCIPIDRAACDIDAIRRCTALLKAGGSLCIFPQGHLQHSGALQSIEQGSSLIAAQAGVLEDAQYGADILVTYRIPAGADEALRTALREASSGTIAPQLLEEIFCAG